MIWFFVFLVMAVMVSPSEMKTMEQMENELDFLKMKIESCVASTEKLEKDMEAFNNLNEKTRNIVTENQERLFANEGKISKLENDVTRSELKSSYCAYQDFWAGPGGSLPAPAAVITYDSLLVDDNNIDRASFNIGTGQFTAGWPGVYSVQFTIGAMKEYYSNGHITEIYIRRNGQNIPESHLLQRTAADIDGQYNYEVGGRSMMVNMETGDTLEAYARKIGEIEYVTFCISLTK